MTRDNDELRGSMRDHPWVALLIVSITWLLFAMIVVGLFALLMLVDPGINPFPWMPWILALLIYVCWRSWQWAVQGRPMPRWMKRSDPRDL